MANRQTNHPPLLLTRLWERTSAKGTTYLAGRLGAARVLVMPNRDRQGDDDPTHLLMAVAPGEAEGAR